jgi:putative heme-binding domain-containing protein
LALANDPDPRVRFQLELTLGELNRGQNLAALAQLTRSAVADPWQSLAILSSVGDRPWPLLKRLFEQDPHWLDAPGADEAQFLDRMAALVGASGNQSDLAELLTVMTRTTRDPSVSAHLALLAGLADGLAQSNQSLRGLVRQPPGSLQAGVRSLNELIQQAANLAVSDEATRRARLGAVRILAGTEPGVAGKVLLNLMLPPNPTEVQAAATKALAEFKDPYLATTMFASWSRYSRKTRSQLLAAGLRTTVFTTALLDALEQGRIAPGEVDPYTRTALLKIQSTEFRQRADKLLVNTLTPDRERVIREFQPALKLAGDRRHGAVVFANVCLVCHAIQGQGNQVGPDLSGVGSHPRETLLVDILDPSRQVLPDYVNYVLITADGGETLTGYIETETPTTVTLRRPREPDVTIPRSQIQELRADGKSPMPEGLEQGLGPQDMADLLEFLSQPDAKLLPKEQ